ncbi:MAG: glycosyltransferase family 4 protein [Ruminococcaceae bacterium]|nr:glycosyltransferase family 4 protein [Oscillospiraceae bacterium]
MNIVHITPSAPYNDYWGYQDNLLPKYHKKLGHQVTMITTNYMHKDGKIVPTECGDYVLDDGVRVIRLARKKYFHHTVTNIRSYLPVFDLLKKLKPDFIFFHGLMSATIYDVVAYKKKHNRNCVIVQDNHLDYNIGRRGNGIKDNMLRMYYRHVVRKTIEYVDHVYGVTPWRKQYAEEYFQVPKDKTSVLIMGADDEEINFEQREAVRAHIRTSYGITPNDFLVATGGKIDEKKKIHFLMQAICGLERVKLLIFGQVMEDIHEEFERLLEQNSSIIYVGWIPSRQVYDYFFASDLVFFPGQHSVLWEQACATKVPCVFQRWEGMEHIDNGGNSDFLATVSVESIRSKLLEVLYTEKYQNMKKIAASEKTDIYLYSKIAEKSLECWENMKKNEAIHSRK